MNELPKTSQAALETLDKAINGDQPIGPLSFEDRIKELERVLDKLRLTIRPYIKSYGPNQNVPMFEIVDLNR
jgi:hypothetical protein